MIMKISFKLLIMEDKGIPVISSHLFLLPGQIQWVVDGQIVANKNMESIKQSAQNHPSDLSGHLLLGKMKFASQNWGSMKNKVTMLNVFSSTLPIDKMQKLTIIGEERCTLEGDYLSWTDMQWTLHGGSSNQTLTKEDVCTSQGRTFNFFGGPFPGVQACAQHCRKLGSRMPSITNPTKLTNLQMFLKKNFWDKRIVVGNFFLALTDTREEGVWGEEESTVATDTSIAVVGIEESS